CEKEIVKRYEKKQAVSNVNPDMLDQENENTVAENCPPGPPFPRSHGKSLYVSMQFARDEFVQVVTGCDVGKVLASQLDAKVRLDYHYQIYVIQAVQVQRVFQVGLRLQYVRIYLKLVY